MWKIIVILKLKKKTKQLQKPCQKCQLLCNVEMKLVILMTCQFFSNLHPNCHSQTTRIPFIFICSSDKNIVKHDKFTQTQTQCHQTTQQKTEHTFSNPMAFKMATSNISKIFSDFNPQFAGKTHIKTACTSNNPCACTLQNYTKTEMSKNKLSFRWNVPLQSNHLFRP